MVVFNVTMNAQDPDYFGIKASRSFSTWIKDKNLKTVIVGNEDISSIRFRVEDCDDLYEFIIGGDYCGSTPFIGLVVIKNDSIIHLSPDEIEKIKSRIEQAQRQIMLMESLNEDGIYYKIVCS